MSDSKTSGREQTERRVCKSCKDPIEGRVVLLHGKYPFCVPCYKETVGGNVPQRDTGIDQQEARDNE
jgi:hypothetical protein